LYRIRYRGFDITNADEAITPCIGDPVSWVDRFPANR
jgi:hypothetical protein